MSIYLLEDTLQIDVFYECEDQDLEDNVCLSIIERCPQEEKLFQSGETRIYLTSDQARKLGSALLDAAEQSNHSPGD